MSRIISERALVTRIKPPAWRQEANRGLRAEVLGLYGAITDAVQETKDEWVDAILGDREGCAAWDEFYMGRVERVINAHFVETLRELLPDVEPPIIDAEEIRDEAYEQAAVTRARRESSFQNISG
jgi:hypothetical protein